MEDEHRPLPPGWIRQYDSTTNHQFFVDTRADPPRSIWHHPHDDDTYLDSLTASERTRINSIHSRPNDVDLAVESEDDQHAATSSPKPPSPSDSSEASGAKKYAYKLKDRITHSTHAERQAERDAKRAQREADERRMYEQHQAFRRAMAKAMETGQPQLLGTDSRGKQVYVEPPMGYGGYAGGGAYGGGGYGYSPYGAGMYGVPNGRYMRPAGPYGRPMGYGYGGGIGLPILGGLAGGALLGGLMF